MTKQRLRELRNKVETAGFKMLPVNLDKTSNSKDSGRGKEGLTEALKRAQVSSASRGKFDRLARNEKKMDTNRGKKAKLVGSNVASERAAYLKTLDRMERGSNEKPLNVNKVSGLVQGQSEAKNRASKIKGSSNKNNVRKGGKKGGKSKN